MAGRSRSSRPDITSVIIRLELLGYEYRGVDYPNGGVCVMYGVPARGPDTFLIPGANFGAVMAAIDRLPILNPDPLVHQLEARTRATAATADPAMQRATERQVKFIFAIAREAGLDEQELSAWSQGLYGQEVSQLNRRDASTLIEALQRRRNEIA